MFLWWTLTIFVVLSLNAWVGRGRLGGSVCRMCALVCLVVYTKRGVRMLMTNILTPLRSG